MSASDEPRRGWGNCVHVPDPCTTATGVAIAANALNRMLDLGRPEYARIA